MLMFQLKLLDHKWSHISQKNGVIHFQLIQYQSDFVKACFMCLGFLYVKLNWFTFLFKLFWFYIFTLFKKSNPPNIFKAQTNTEHLISKDHLLLIPPRTWPASL